MRYESYNFVLTVQHDNGRPYMMIRSVQLLRQLESLELGFGFYDGRVGARVIGSRAIGRIVARPHTSSDDVTV